MHRIASVMAAGLYATASARPWSRDTTGYNGTDTNTTMVYSHADITPSEQLTWVPCFDNPNLACANLLVPLDFADPSAGHTNMAWIKYVSSNDSAEDIIFNPGGPGVSGIGYIVSGVETMQKNFGSQYNYISFDPRGVNTSGPALSCFPGSPENKAAYTEPGKTTPLQELYQRNKAYGEYCSQANADTEAKYAGTVATAQSIMYFVDLRAAEKGTSVSGNSSEEAKLWYYGVSYGTALGQTLASLFPQRIGRMILDGNVYGVQHYTGVLPSDVDDTDAAYHSFFTSCFEAGPDKCAFYGNDTTSSDDIEKRYLTLLQNLRELPVIANGETGPRVVTDFEVVNQGFQMLYDPMTNSPKMASLLAELESGVVADALKELLGTNIPTYAPHADASSNDEGLQLITCLDANKNYPITSYQQYLDEVEVYKKESYYAGTNSALTNLLLCVGMSLTPPESQQFPGFKPDGTTTSFPILFVNPIRDPITPLSSAHKMSALFPGSAVLAQDSTGHGVTTAESKCTTGYLQAYMQQGTLPPSDTICKPDVKPFVDSPTKRALLPRAMLW